MSKHDVLTEEEFARFSPNERTLGFIETCREALGIAKSEFRILDWGCGRGRHVLWLREQGYDAHGVDIDELPVRNGIPLFEQRGQPATCLKLLTPEGRSDFPDGSFHFTYSHSVLEHVADLPTVATEIGRLTATGGMGYHCYPARWYVVEGHLLMPCIHWLPKNLLRRTAIRGYVLLGREPRWHQLAGMSQVDKAATYYDYSIRKTYYRSYAEVREDFRQGAIETRCVSISHPRVVGHPVLKPLMRTRAGRSAIALLMRTFKFVELLIEKS